MNIILISSIAAFIPIGVYILFLRWLDRYEREPFRLVAITFVAGATFSIIFGLVGESVLAVFSQILLSKTGGEYAMASLIAPFIEEIGKGIVVLIFALCSKEFDNLTDGILYGAIVGLGFAFTENIIYFFHVYNQSGEFAWIQNMYFRSFFATGVHASATALFGAAVAQAKFLKITDKFVVGLIGLALAMMAHSFWNSIFVAASLSQDILLTFVPLFCMPFLFLGLFLLIQFSLANESQMIERELTEEAKGGILPLSHVVYLKSYLKRNTGNWLKGSIPKEKYISLATDLAFLRNHYWQASPNKRLKVEKELNNLREKVRAVLAGLEAS